ncbi:MAG: isoprenylcysteine carboxylmethyltransferase family protein [Candidatus Bathyarchaeota archaeon]|nr:isoprenylcysteine carboxylmethyltransferase family protein [Candidatus Bathyarchaeum sp.]
MSFIPVFELGLWNAWIFVLLGLLIGFISWSLIGKKAMKKFRYAPNGHKTGAKKTSQKLFFLLALASMVYSVFLPINLGTLWFYAGLTIWVLSIIISLISFVSFGTTPLDELVSKGTYRISRNPVFLSGFLADLGIGIACASWIYVLYAVIDLILMHFYARTEEAFLLEKYGDTYREYMKRTPRWIGIPQSKEIE